MFAQVGFIPWCSRFFGVCFHNPSYKCSSLYDLINRFRGGAPPNVARPTIEYIMNQFFKNPHNDFGCLCNVKMNCTAKLGASITYAQII